MSNDLTPKRKAGRPRKAVAPVAPSIVDSQNRIPVGAKRLKTEIYGKNPAYHYQMVLDHSDKGFEINKYLQAGYTFVTDNEGVTVGDSRVFKTDSFGSILTVPNADGRTLFCMKQPMEFYNEDQAEKERQIKLTEQAMFSPNEREGQYGSVKSEWKTS